MIDFSARDLLYQRGDCYDDSSITTLTVFEGIWIIPSSQKKVCRFGFRFRHVRDLG